jgi:hypothetical protein
MDMAELERPKARESMENHRTGPPGVALGGVFFLDF